MANKKISQLSSGAPVLSTDMFPIERGTIPATFNFKLTIQNVLSLISSYLFPTLSAISTTVSTTANAGTITASNDLNIGGKLSATSTTVHHGAVTNLSTVTTTGNTVNDGATVFNDTTTTNTQLTIDGNTTYTTTAPATFFNTLLTGASASTTVEGAFTTQGATTLKTGAYVATNPSDSDNSNKIATTQFVINNSVGVGQSWRQYGPYPNAARVSGVVYYNIYSKPLIINVNASDSYYWGGDSFLFIDTAANPGVCTTLLASAKSTSYPQDAYDTQQLYGIIPPGRAYKVQSDLIFQSNLGNIDFPNRWGYWAEFT